MYLNIIYVFKCQKFNINPVIPLYNIVLESIIHAISMCSTYETMQPDILYVVYIDKNYTAFKSTVSNQRIDKNPDVLPGNCSYVALMHLNDKLFFVQPELNPFCLVMRWSFISHGDNMG